jgi:hypothetical protein
MTMRKTFWRRRGWAAALALTLAAPTAASATVSRIEGTAPLSDHSDRAIEHAVRAAVDHCVSSATAMGLLWIWLEDARVLTDRVIVEMIATDEVEEDDALAAGQAQRPLP